MQVNVGNSPFQFFQTPRYTALDAICDLELPPLLYFKWCRFEFFAA